MNTELFAFNGIDGATGNYLLPPMSPEQVSEIAQGARFDREHLLELQWKHQQVTQKHLGPKEGVDPTKLAESGWGVIFARDADPAIKEALSELLGHRRNQANRIKERYQEYTGTRGYRPGESKVQFLARQGVGSGPVDPDRVPYYLLIVGDPESIPFSFQYQLDVAYAVGRIHFLTLDEYAQYAHTVVMAESAPAVKSPRAVFFATENSDDKMTSLSANYLAAPLAESLAENRRGWKVQTVLGGEATKVRLVRLLDGSETPALLFTASHGMGFPIGDRRQLPHQGALVCQDWPGPLRWRTSIPEDFYVGADDVGNQAKLEGLVTFHFACYSAGTPRLDEFAHRASSTRAPIAPHAFVARLPQRLLGRPAGGALAVIGHMERAWGYSFIWERAGAQLAVFESTLKRLMEGHPIGSAVEFLNERYAEISSDLNHEIEEIKFGKLPDHLALSGMWTANNDARNYAIIGDPAVRLR